MAARGRKQIVNNPLSFFSYVGGIPSDFTDETDPSVRHLLFSELRNLFECSWQTGKVSAYFSKWQRTFRHPASIPDPKGSNIDELQQYALVELRCEIDTNFDFQGHLRMGRRI